MQLQSIQVLLFFVVVFILSANSKQVSEEDDIFWRKSSKKTLSSILNRSQTNGKPAANVILFIGDGMGLSTITAGRTFVGQLNGHSGEETKTSFDDFYHIGLAKVYSIDKQTPDSASTATAILSGAKTRNKMLGLNGKAVFRNCSSSLGNHVKSILEESADKQKSTGIVTTTQVQHATPAAAYAHCPSRSWFDDSSMDKTSLRQGCKDISLQLLEKGRQINVILGGGRSSMRPSGLKDEEYGSRAAGNRKDNRNLIDEWKNLPPNKRAKYVWNLTDFNSVDSKDTDFLLGLFQPHDLRYDHERKTDVGGEPSLQQMTQKAIEILQKNPEGYFLLVEGGKIDHAHHANQANIAVREFHAFNLAIQAAINQTDPQNTLIVVTADHGHVFSVGGYSDRGNPISGFARSNSKPDLAGNGKQYTSIIYGNGPGYRQNNHRQTDELSYRFQAAVPLPFETHSAEDTVVFARGPMSHLFSGLYEQSYIGYAMKYASCVGTDQSLCTENAPNNKRVTLATQTNVPPSKSAFISKFVKKYSTTGQFLATNMPRENRTNTDGISMNMWSTSKFSQIYTQSTPFQSSNARNKQTTRNKLTKEDYRDDQTTEHKSSDTSLPDLAISSSVVTRRSKVDTIVNQGRPTWTNQGSQYFIESLYETTHPSVTEEEQLFKEKMMKMVTNKLSSLYNSDENLTVTVQLQLTISINPAPQQISGIAARSLKLKSIKNINDTFATFERQRNQLASYVNIIAFLSAVGITFCVLSFVLFILVLRLRRTLSAISVGKNR